MRVLELLLSWRFAVHSSQGITTPETRSHGTLVMSVSFSEEAKKHVCADTHHSRHGRQYITKSTHCLRSGTRLYAAVKLEQVAVYVQPLRPNRPEWGSLHTDAGNTFASHVGKDRPSHGRTLNYTHVDQALLRALCNVVDHDWQTHWSTHASFV